MGTTAADRITDLLSDGQVWTGQLLAQRSGLSLRTVRRAAAAHKLARLINAMLTRGQPYTDQGQAYCEERYRERVVANLTRRAQQLGLNRVPLAGASPQTTTA
jgi:hypothetical protein